jgi:NDP-sugar pyrophosphorylase family protein/aminoglycoside/choline kinase family phosphotransferase
MKSNSLTLFLPAAGLGERLRPITSHVPKPLLPIMGRPLLDIIIGKLSRVSSGRIGINLHYKKEMILDWVENSPYKNRITFFPEDPILGTGGALKNARAFLSAGPFLVHNSDILIDIDFERLIEEHISSGNIATLVTHDYQRFNNVIVDGKGRVLDVEKRGERKTYPAGAKKVAFTGVAVYSAEILDFIPKGVSHVTSAWVSAARAGRRVQSVDFTGAYWNDIGTPAGYAGAILESMSRAGETIYVSPKARCKNIQAEQYVILEAGSEVLEGSRLRNCIVLGARVSGINEDRIIGPDYSLPLTDSDMQYPLYAAEEKAVSLSEPLFKSYFPSPYKDFKNIRGQGADVNGTGDEKVPAMLVGFGGSDRRYFRVRHDGMSAILMECLPRDRDFERHIEFTKFFTGNGVPVPKLLAEDEANKRALFEDLGDVSLYSWLRLPRDRERIQEIYRGIMEILAPLHAKAYEKTDNCLLLREKIFDYEHLRWETGYFLERFVRCLLGVEPDNTSELENEFHRLALLTDSFPKGVVHRDFQSQNIMITGGRPRVIDYQGARIGPPAYDLASVLWDPYYRLDEGMREEALSYYISLREEIDKTFLKEEFRKTLIPCRLQRHMQALGAYGFLSKVKGKKNFLKHVPEGFRLLQADIAESGGTYLALSRLIEKIEGPVCNLSQEPP